MSNVLKLTNGFFLCFYELVLLGMPLFLLFCFYADFFFSVLLLHRENMPLVSFKSL